ncbi:MAG: hypothetical protein DMG41_12555 [Acidobacteria bacterium]|nr:MAG: hypothetical protein AUH13_06090 [Acidobacteria bacterium 13_2_20CM_58_27]PYT65684.1 MAG: hypothetical protein DMG42_31660 [Acidobacteriota bacterium]PYT88178.1 MAG: hypothetical protein DMG41_12555 [Acidobacteriota bacterium]
MGFGHRHAVAFPPKQSIGQFLLVLSAVAERDRQRARRDSFRGSCFYNRRRSARPRNTSAPSGR